MTPLGELTTFLQTPKSDPRPELHYPNNGHLTNLTRYTALGNNKTFTSPEIKIMFLYIIQCTLSYKEILTKQ